MTTPWKHTQPYPTWPFTLVPPKELVQYMRAKQPPIEEALL